MILQGLALTVIGMGTVFVFLFLLILLVSNLASFVAVLDRVCPPRGEASEKTRETLEMPMIAAAVLVAARHAR